MGTKVAEIRQDHRGDRRGCPICSPPDRRKVIGCDELWAHSLVHGCNPFRKGA